MKALTIHGKHQIRYESIPDPEILLPTDVIVKVKACAICGSDLHVFHDNEKGIDAGTAMGHEFTGEIVDLGKEVKSFRKGELVMTPFTTNCGQCFYCKMGLTCRCEKSQLYGWVEKEKGLQGGQAEYVRVPLADNTLMRIPEGITIEEGLLLGDVLSTGFFCAQQAEIKPQGVYAVIGLGPVGLMTVLGALEAGAEKVYALDAVPERLSMAAHFGATTIDIRNAFPLGVIHEATDGRGADGVMEAVGSRSAVRLAIELVRPGGIISSVGVCTDEHLAFSPVEAYNKNLTYKIGRCPARHMMDKLVPLVLQKKYDFASVFSHTMKLSEGVKGYDIFANKKDQCLKVLLQPD
jgi:threonine dehydrogenase-like Zn-dependent dehydrogenase